MKRGSVLSVYLGPYRLGIKQEGELARSRPLFAPAALPVPGVKMRRRYISMPLADPGMTVSAQAGCSAASALFTGGTGTSRHIVAQCGSILVIQVLSAVFAVILTAGN